MANYNEIVNLQEVSETNAMIEHNNLDVRTITMGISLLDCGAEHVDAFCDHIYNKITKKAEKLVETGEEISREYGIPIVHKRISVTPIAIAGASACHSSQDFVKVAETLDRAAKTCGVNFLGGFSAICQKGATTADELLMRAIPEALSKTEVVCSSVNVGSTKTGINMDAVRLMG